MFVLRCTQKLLYRLSSKPDPDLAPPDTVLGDWYANLIRVGRIQVVLAVSERSLLPVMVPARDSRALVPRLCEALAPILAEIGVPADDVAAERGAMQRWAVGKTANRRVLGSLNDLAFQLEVGLLNSPGSTSVSAIALVGQDAPESHRLRCTRPSHTCGVRRTSDAAGSHRPMTASLSPGLAVSTQ